MEESGEAEDVLRPYRESSFQAKIDGFMEMLKNMTMQGAEATPEERRQQISENLRFDEFCDAIRSLFGSDVQSQDLKQMYRKLTTNPDAKIDWTEIFGYLQNEKEEPEQNLLEEVTVFMTSKRTVLGDAAGDKKRRDTVQGLAVASAIDCYLCISQKKCVTVWSNKLKLQACTELNEQSWATAVEYMPGIRRIAASTERSLNFMDHRAKGANQQIFSVKPLAQSPQCLCHVPYGRSSQEDTLLFGDDHGYVNFVTITQKDLTPRQLKGDKRMMQSFEIDPANLTEPMKRRKFHSDWVLKVKYFPELKCFASCSPCETASFILEPVERIWDNTQLKPAVIPKGVNAFDYCPRANVIVTGGVDKVVRVWHPHIWGRPTGKLVGHLFTISEVVCNDKDQHIISLSTARVFRVWDIHTLTCLQIFTDSDERPGERRIYALVYDNRHDRLLSGSSVIEAWPLTRAVQDTMQVPHTHDRPIVLVLLNAKVNQFVSVCSEPVIKVWEVDSGHLVYQIVEPHGPGIEVTAMTVDDSGYRLATGAFNGSIVVWDFGSGQELKALRGTETDEDLTIFGLTYCEVEGYRCIVGCGWNNKVKIFVDTNEGGRELLYLRSFSDDFCYAMSPVEQWDLSSGGSRRDSEAVSSQSLNPYSVLPDIGDSQTSGLQRERLLRSHELTSQSALMPEVLITGCQNGNLLLWDISKAIVEKLVMLPVAEASSKASGQREKNLQKNPFRVTGVRILVHRSRKVDPEFLKELKLKGLAPDSSYAGLSEENKENTTSFRESKATTRMSRRPTKSLATITDLHTERLESVVNDETARSDTLEEFPVFEEEEEEDLDPSKHMIEETFPPVIVSVHEDGHVRFWDLDGEMLASVIPEGFQQGCALTSLCADPDADVLVVGDKRGYLTHFDVAKFLEQPHTDPNTGVLAQPPCQVVYWRAHLSKVVSLDYLPESGCFVSGSADGSARLWLGGRFVGFFGQVRSLAASISAFVSRDEETAGPPPLPYDIMEVPVFSQHRTQSAQQKSRATRNMEYPLQFLEDRWDPFSRTRFMQDQLAPPPIVPPKKAIRDILEKPLEKKFFKAVIKPKAYNHHLDSYCSGEKREGAVFRALPVYRVGTPSDVKPPTGLLYVDLDRPADAKKGRKGVQKGQMKNFADGRETQLSKLSSNTSRRSSLAIPKTVR